MTLLRAQSAGPLYHLNICYFYHNMRYFTFLNRDSNLIHPEDDLVRQSTYLFLHKCFTTLQLHALQKHNGSVGSKANIDISFSTTAVEKEIVYNFSI